MKPLLTALSLVCMVFSIHPTTHGQAPSHTTAVKTGPVLFRFTPEDGESPTSVRIAGSMNGWSITDPKFLMARDADGSYSLRVALKPGRYYFKFVVDGKWARDMKAFAECMAPRQVFFDGSGLNSAGLDVADDGVAADGPGTDIQSAPRRFAKEVSNFAAEADIGKALLSWRLDDASGVTGIEVLARLHFESLYDPSYTVVATLPPTATSAEVALEPLADATLKVRLVAGDTPSRGVSTRLRIRHPRVAVDACDGRTLFIRLPDGYEAAKGPFPVVYMHDGQNLFSTASGSAEEWRVDETLDRLERAGKVEKMVVVGIFASGDRASEYLPFTIPGFMGADTTFVGHGAEYAAWVAERVVPYIESKYNVSRERKDRAVMGSSFGGVLALWTIAHQPEVYSFGGVMSAAPVPGLVEDITFAAKGDTKIWIDAGEFEEGFDACYIDQERALTSALLRKGYTYGRDLAYYEVPKATDHRESIVAERVEYPFIFFKGTTPARFQRVEIHTGRSPSRTSPGSAFVNPVADFSNGLRYSLFTSATYTIADARRATVSSAGVVAFNGDASTDVLVTYGDVVLRATVAVDPEAKGPKSGGAVAAGTLLRYAAFESKNIAPRNVDVWLPPGYDENPAARYPVIYMHDGQNLFDSATAGYGVEWEIDEAMGRLIERGEIRPAIVVGIWNTRMRIPEYMPARPVIEGGSKPVEVVGQQMGGRPLSDGYLTFIVDELKPFVDRTYRTMPGRDDTFVMGSSMGGLISLYAMCEHPDVFGGAGCVSTHWPAGNGIVVDYLGKAAPDPTTHRFYFDHGTEGLDAQYAPFQKRADDALRTAGYTENRNWMTRTFQGADHNERSWSQRVDIPLKFLLGRKP